MPGVRITKCGVIELSWGSARSVVVEHLLTHGSQRSADLCSLLVRNLGPELGKRLAIDTILLIAHIPPD